MDFSLTEEQVILKDTIRKFLEKEILFMVEKYESEKKPLTKEIFKKLEPYGYTKAIIPEEKGGLGLDFVSYCLMVEELGRIWGSLRTIVSSSGLVTYAIAKKGTEVQREKFLPKLLSMDNIGCFAITEPNAGSDNKAMEAKAVLNGNHYVLNGTKTLITGGSIADVVLVFATVDKAKGAKGITAFLVQKGQSEFQANNIRKMGMHSAVLSELVFDECKIPVENRLGNEGEGLKTALTTLNMGRIGVTFAVIGLAQAALDACIPYAKERIQFGKPIGSFQLVQDMIINMAMKVDIARLLGYRAATFLDKGIDCRREASFAKLFATEAAMEVTNMGIQVHGGYGYTEEFPLERYYRDARHLTMAEGTSEIQKLIIGRDILGISAIV
jgi:alkylation response protein AidB-like acyl-CoA dehydrogenase